MACDLGNEKGGICYIYTESSCPLSAFPGVSIELKIMIIVSENKLPKNWVVWLFCLIQQELDYSVWYTKYVDEDV